MAIAFAQGVKKSGATTDAADFSACNGAGGLLVAIAGYFTEGSGVADSTGANTWVPGTEHDDTSGGGRGRTYYVLAPTATGSQTFSFGGSFYSLVVFGFTGVDSFDQQSGAGSATQPGSLTPTVDGTSLFVDGSGDGGYTTATASSPFGGTELVNANNPGVAYPSAGAYYIQGSSGAQNPTWTLSGGTTACSMMVFKPAAGGGGDTQEWFGQTAGQRSKQVINVSY